MNKSVFKNKYLFILTISISLCIFSCKNNDSINKSIVNESIIINNENIVQDMDISDVTSDAEKNHLLRMDDINKLLGHDYFISKKNYYKYRDTKITLIGDSIAEGAKNPLIRYFKNIHIDSLAGREIETAYEVFNRLLNYGKIGDIVIVSLGTNAKDGIRTDKLEMIHEKLNDKPMFLFSIVMPYKGQERNRNRDIEKFVNTHNNCYLIDYHKIMKNHPEYFNEDGVHPNGLGSEIYAHMLFKAIIDLLN